MSVKDYPPVGSISSQLTQQHVKKMRAKKHRGHKGGSAPRGPKVPDLQQLARHVANQSLGVNRPGRLAGQDLETAARKAAGSSLGGWK